MKLWKAYLETQNFVFETYGKTEQDARQKMHWLLWDHCSCCCIDEYQFMSTYWEDVSFELINTDHGYRDHQEFPLTKKEG